MPTIKRTYKYKVIVEYMNEKHQFLNKHIIYCYTQKEMEILKAKCKFTWPIGYVHHEVLKNG